jgi:hypothetical protein
LVPGHFQNVLLYGPTKDFRQFFDTSPLAQLEGTEKAL